jgi:hypothetical protein
MIIYIDFIITFKGLLSIFFDIPSDLKNSPKKDCFFVGGEHGTKLESF